MVVSNKGVLQMYTKMKAIEMSNHSFDESVDFEIEWDNTLEEINQIADELNQLGWEYFSAGGYMGWNKAPNNTGVFELNADTLRQIFFCYDTEMNIVINFTNVDKGIFEITMSHHDSPMGETVYFVKEHYLEVENEWESPTTHCIDVATEKGIR
tara:strand:+ start:1696 stop:2157 length:462 start_codon:yes stop_codon:yes gene_type:complete